MSGFTFTSAVTLTFTHDSLLGSPVTSSPSPPPDAFGGDMCPPLWPRLFAEPPPTVEQMDAFWNGGEDDDEEEEEEEERLPDYVQPIRGEPYKDYLAWHEAGFNKLRQAKVTADERMAVAARDACDLMQQAKDGNTFALDEVKRRLHGAIGKKKQKLMEWRVPGRDNAARNEVKRRRHFAAYETAKAAEVASGSGLGLSSTTPKPHLMSPLLSPHLASHTSRPTPEPAPREPTPEPAPCKPTPEPAPREPTPKPHLASPHLASPLQSLRLVSPSVLDGQRTSPVNHIGQFQTKTYSHPSTRSYSPSHSGPGPCPHPRSRSRSHSHSRSILIIRVRIHLLTPPLVPTLVQASMRLAMFCMKTSIGHATVIPIPICLGLVLIGTMRILVRAIGHVRCGGMSDQCFQEGEVSHGNPSHVTGSGTMIASGPGGPISGSHRITAHPSVVSGPIAETTGAAHEPVKLGQWFAIDVGPLPDGFKEPEVWLDLYPQVIASRRLCRKTKINIQLLLKSQQKRDKLAHGAEVGVNTIDEPSAPSDRFTSRKDLEYERADRASYGNIFLSYDTFPPIIGPAVSKLDRLHQLQCVEFDTEWLIQKLASLPPTSIDLPLCHMELLMRAHKHRAFGAGFVVTMWPTEGPVHSVIRRICRMASAAFGNTLTTNPVADEMFGFSKDPSAWHIKLDLTRDCPQSPKFNDV
ncbi:hypothetical protein BS47DRAFT_1369904 [Hydnum rufescens UP504]|uniref:Uncharacterized protein n=1 Tax=Hydnum rufescens UP504 TaxID=1448309 RepID=A0A9P6ACQ0_9AGAM|nr:hypothetical protein BS47DRAFT_1369904 [Hydnum rufescens UP504]